MYNIRKDSIKEMPQRKTNTKKRKTSSRGKKPKVYIPAYKIIMLCVAIITICMSLLLFTTVSSQNKEKPQIAKTEKKQTPATTEKEVAKVESTSNQPKKENKTSKEKSTSNNKDKYSDSNKVDSSAKSEKTPTPATQKKSTVAPQTAQSKKNSFDFPAAQNGAQLIFVFDDGGQNLAQLKPFLQLPFPLTVAVLPDLPHSVESANQILNARKEVILHQPMQSINNNVNPGPGAIKPDMSEDEITSTLFKNINQLGEIAGINNHEGSAITADAEKMALIMKIASDCGLYFLDSRTNVETKVPYVASELGFSYYERNIFLDNEKTRENALKELKKGLALANKNGSVIMIGHIWSADFLPALLQEAYPELKEKGYTFSVVSKSKARK